MIGDAFIMMSFIKYTGVSYVVLLLMKQSSEYKDYFIGWLTISNELVSPYISLKSGYNVAIKLIIWKYVINIFASVEICITSLKSMKNIETYISDRFCSIMTYISYV